MRKNQVYNNNSKERLLRDAKKRMNTVMIGSLATIEKYFGNLWGENEEQQTEQQKMLEDIYESLRTEILDKGNDQIRRFSQDLDQYDINFVGYQYTFPFVKE